MAGWVYIAFVFAGTVLGAFLGAAAHFWRAHATMYAEDLGLGEPLNTMTREDYQWEKHVVGAEWDDAGFWAAGSVRNLAYYILSGMGTALLLGLAFWPQRIEIVGALCQALGSLGLKSPVCF